MFDHEVFLRHLRGPQAFLGSIDVAESLQMCLGRGRHRILLALLASIAVHGTLLATFGNVLLTGTASSQRPFRVSLVQKESPVAEIPDPGRNNEKSDVLSELSSSRPDVSKSASSPRLLRPIDKKVASEHAVNALPAAKQSQIERTKSIQVEPMTGAPFPASAVPLKRVEIGFELFSGADRRPLGAGTQTYAADHAGNFELSIKENSSPGNAPEKRWGVSIVGKVLKNGLLTSGFRAQGDLSEQLLALVSSPGTSSNASEDRSVRVGRMPDGILDRQSMLYQFMIRPPKLPSGKLMIADGKTYALFSYTLAGTEDFHLQAFGKVSAMKLVFSSEEIPDVIELWLAPTLHFLPLKVRSTDRNKQILEQQVVSLAFD